MTLIDSENLRFIWGLVENYSHVLKDMSDDAACFWLLKQIRENIHLNHAEMVEIKAYIGSRIHLIRDLENPENIQGYGAPV
ncbi:MAG: hypothetical protein AAF821_23690 [Cyanobacteria bacterium P01_D01_bin.156]